MTIGESTSSQSSPRHVGQEHAVGEFADRVRTSMVVMSAMAVGVLLSVVWSFELADRVIGAGIANTALGTEAASVELNAGGLWLGLFFAFVAGLAATFTACNVVVFGCVVPLVKEKGNQVASLEKVVGWMTLGVLAVTALYGAIGAIIGSAVPALSNNMLTIGGAEYPVRLMQSTAVFTMVGLLLVWWGLAMFGLVANPLARVTAASPWLRPFGLGVLIGLFSVGRPYPLFRKLFEHAAEVANPIFGATAMMLQGLGNILLAVALLALLVYGTGGRFERWMREQPRAVTTLAAASLIAGGAFFIIYWGVRVPSYFGIGWFPHMPYR